MTGVVRSRFHTATHPVPAVHGSPVRPLFATAAGMPAADPADPAWHMASRYRPPDALRRAGTLAQADPPATMTAASPTDQADARNAANERIHPEARRCMNIRPGRL